VNYFQSINVDLKLNEAEFGKSFTMAGDVFPV
jgi:hypothetical protein